MTRWPSSVALVSVGTRAPSVKPVGYCLAHDDIIGTVEGLLSEVYLEDSL